MRPAVRLSRAWLGAFIFAGGLAVALVPRALGVRAVVNADVSVPMEPGVGMPGGPPTSADGLKARVNEMESRLQRQPDDLGASVLLADALLRVARATNDSRPAGRAADVLRRTLVDHPGAYDALRMLGAIELSLHRFHEALEVGRTARDMRPDDAWNYGVIGDASIELGDYDEAFKNFDRMMDLRPTAAAYARIAYARELTGDLAGAQAAMEAAFASAPVQDVEARAWYSTQLGELHLKRGVLTEAQRAFRQAEFLFAAYPPASVGLGKVLVARGDDDGALRLWLDQLARTPTLDLAARIGDIHARAGRTAEAEHYYKLAEDVAGPAPAQTEANLALFLSERGRRLPDAVALAEAVARVRHDINTEHALAWSYYRIGRIDDADAAMTRALRTGSRDEALLAHAAVISRAKGH